MSVSKPILCVDFDGVLHSYTSPWVDEKTIPDPPVPGALRWLANATKLFNVTIYSSRSKSREGVAAMGSWLQEWTDKERLPDKERLAIDEVGFASEKPAAFLTIDDRAIQFDGDWAAFDPEKLRRFKPWNKR